MSMLKKTLFTLLFSFAIVGFCSETANAEEIIEMPEGVYVSKESITPEIIELAKQQEQIYTATYQEVMDKGLEMGIRKEELICVCAFCPMNAVFTISDDGIISATWTISDGYKIIRQNNPYVDTGFYRYEIVQDQDGNVLFAGSQKDSASYVYNVLKKGYYENEISICRASEEYKFLTSVYGPMRHSNDNNLPFIFNFTDGSYTFDLSRVQEYEDDDIGQIIYLLD